MGNMIDVNSINKSSLESKSPINFKSIKKFGDQKFQNYKIRQRSRMLLLSIYSCNFILQFKLLIQDLVLPFSDT